MAGPNDWNAQTIERFRATDGTAPGPGGTSLVLLHHTGAKSGQVRVNPLAYHQVDGGYAIFASKGGAPSNPDWYYNLVANPDATIEIGSQTIPVRARVAEGSERERIWEEQKRRFPQFAKYEETANRTIPVVILEPR